ncbi:hypothetical protein ACPPVU_21850 [Mucilaginibacter sp. McL0603]|uniref:hypothetical protein n=1 Tax=Mucilaginibacter sp. McL0603 TaxID=3415670 RepID=UPI003CF77B85
MRAFNEISIFDAGDRLKTSLKSEIETKSKEFILGVDEQEFKDFLYAKYKLEPLTVYFESEATDKPVISKESREGRYPGEKYQVDTYQFNINYSFSGSAAIFRIHPSRWEMTSYDISVNESTQKVSLSFKLYNQSPEEFFKEKEAAKNKAFANLDNANRDAEGWNYGLNILINGYFSDQKLKFQKENDFFAAINIPIDKGTQSIFTPPLIKKREIPQPIVSKSQQFAPEPTMSNSMYDDILKIIYDSGKSMERKPSLYIGKDEEGLRDQFLFILETRYDAVTATGETFNRSGKTDIILKYSKDGSNLFVAECKFWHGFKLFLDTISQLFDRYLTWRDSKVAVIIFVQNNDFTSVLKNIAAEIRNHPYYLKSNGQKGESSFSYIFRLQQDPAKHVLLEVMAFHYDKIP